MLICSGYMAPEYAMHGQFSVKSDVFSFGVLILEIVSGSCVLAYFHIPKYGCMAFFFFLKKIFISFKNSDKSPRVSMESMI